VNKLLAYAVALSLFLPASAVAAGATAIPIEVDQGLVVATVTIGSSRPLSFLVDTGAETTVVAAESLEAMGLAKGRRSAASVQGGEIEANTIEGARIALGPVTLTPKTVAAVPLAGLAASIGRRIDGILGYDLFERYIVRLDYDRRRMVLLSPRSPSGRGTAVPIEIRGRTPFVSGTLVQAGRSVPARLLVDTGGTAALTLYQPYVAAHPWLVPDDAIAITGGAILPGQFRARVGRLEQLRVGPFRLDDPVVNYSSNANADDAMAGDAGQIGADVLKRFLVTIDYPHRRILLSPGPEAKAAFVFDASGASIAALPADVAVKRVRQVLPNSPAETAGLKAGDVLAEIDGTPVRTLPLGRIRVMLRLPGRTYRLTVLREGKSLSLQLTTRRLI
jgi:predicted aspartyl protease